MELFFLSRADKRMEQSGNGVRFPGAKNSFIDVMYIFDREEGVRICCPDVFSDPGYIHPVDKRQDHLDISS